MGNQQLRMLLVDAEKNTREQLAAFLREDGPFAVDTTASSEEAMRQICESDQPYDVAVIDELLPEAPKEASRRLGITLMQSLKRYSPRIEVILFRAREVTPLLDDALQAGAFRYLDKSFDRRELTVLIRQAAKYRKIRGAVDEKDILERLAETSSALLGAHTEQEVVHSILEGIRALNFDRVRLYILSADGQYMHGSAHVGMDEHFLTIVRSVTDDKYMRDLINNPRPHVCRRDQREGIPFEEQLDKDGVNEWVCLPLLHQGQVIGALSADNKGSQRPIMEGELTSVALLASQAAIAITQARLFEETKQQAEKLETLRRTTLAITSPAEPQTLWHTIIGHAVALLKAKGGGLYKYYPDQGELEIIADHNRPHYVGKMLRVGEGIAGRLVQDALPYMIVDNYHEWPEKVHPLFTDTDILGSLVEVPLLWQKHMIGVLFIGDDVGRKFTEEDVRLLRLFADQAAISLVNAELTAKDAAKLRRLEKLAHATREITEELGETTLRERLELIARHVTEILDAEVSRVLLTQPSGCLRLEAGYGHRIGSLETGKEYPIRSGLRLGLTSHIAYERKPFRAHGQELTQHWASDGDPPDHIPSGPRYSMLALPLEKQTGDEKQLVGLIRAENKKGRDDIPHPTVGFTDEDEWILNIFAEAVVVAIDSVHWANELHQQKDHWARLVASSPNGIIALDKKGCVTGFNEKAQEILGYTAKEVMHKHANLFYKPRRASETGRLIRAQNGRITKYPISLRSKSGENIPVHLSATFLYDTEEEHIGSVGYFEDLRALRTMENQQALLLSAIDTIARPENSTDGLQELVNMLVTVLDHTFCRLLLADEPRQSLRVEAAHATQPIDKPQSWNPRLKQHLALSEWREAYVLPENGTPTVLVRPIDQQTLAQCSSWLGMQQEIQSLLIIPLKRGPELVGLLEVGELRHGKPFTREQIDLVQAIATQSTALIRNLQLFQESQAAQERLQAAFQASTLLSSQSPDKMLAAMVEQAREAADAMGVRVILRDKAGLLQPIAAVPERYKDSEKYPIRNNGIAQKVMDSGFPEIIPDTSQRRDDMKPALLDNGVMAHCCLPLLLQGKRIGVMSFYYGQPRHFSNVEIEALQLFTNQAAAAYDSARRLTELENLRHAAEALAGAGSLPEVLQQIANSGREVLHADLAAVWPYDPEQGRFVQEGVIVDPQDDLLQQDHALWERVVEAVMQQGRLALESPADAPQVVSLPNAARDFPWPKDVQSLQGLALTVGDEKLGALLLYYRQPHSFQDEEGQQTALTFANHAALALQKARLLDQLGRAKRAAEVVTPDFSVPRSQPGVMRVSAPYPVKAIFSQ